MTMPKCLACYDALEAGQIDFHPLCSKKIFETTEPPKVDISLSEIDELERKIIKGLEAQKGVKA